MMLLLKENKQNFTLLKYIDIGTHNFFDCDFGMQRLGFIESYTKLVIIPVLHRTRSKYMGASLVKDYICYKIIKDKFVALRYEGLL